MLSTLHYMRRVKTYYTQLWTDQGEYELRLLSKLVPRGGLAIDVGANMGIYTFHLARRAARVLAFDPLPQYQADLRKLSARIQVEPYALSDVEGETKLSVPLVEAQLVYGWASLEHGQYPQAQELTVKTRRLDSYHVKPDFMKIDVEGHELKVLMGAEDTLKIARPKLLVECEERHRKGSVQALFDFLKARGYVGYFFADKKAFSTDQFDPAIHQQDFELRPGAIWMRQRLNYINNFVFIPLEQMQANTWIKRQSQTA